MQFFKNYPYNFILNSTDGFVFLTDDQINKKKVQITTLLAKFKFSTLQMPNKKLKNLT